MRPHSLRILSIVLPQFLFENTGNDANPATVKDPLVRSQAEYDMTKALRHENIISAIGANFENPPFFIVLEAAEHGSLEDIVFSEISLVPVYYFGLHGCYLKQSVVS